MDKQRPNILQIQKYLNGELDAKAMHQLEREAQHDPFLMDALDGYAAAKSDQQVNLDLLSAQLKARTEKKERRIIPWTYITIAAGVVGFMIVVGLLYKGNNNPLPAQTAQVQPAAKSPLLIDTAKPRSLTAKPGANDVAAITTPPPKVVLNPAAASKGHLPANKNDLAIKSNGATLAEVAPDKSTSRADTTPMDEMIMGTLAKQKDTGDMPLTVAIKKHPVSQVLNSKAAGVSIRDREGRKEYTNSYYLGNLAPNLQVNPTKQLTGVVIGKTDGAPLPGVTVAVAGKNTGAVTDAQGRFKVPVTGDKATLNIGSLGYESKKVEVNTKDSLKVELNENNSSLAEVVVVQPAGDAAISKAHPKTGWIAFNNYIKQNAILPAGAKTGTVKLKFTVATSGSIGSIKFIQSLSPVADEQAISIIKKGPQWVGNKNGKAETVTLDIKFEQGK